MTRDVDAYWRDGFHHVPGWLAADLLPYLHRLMAAQREAGTKGNVAEIGVYRGKLLLAMAHMTAPGERCVAIDIFDDQAKNLDGSGNGAMAPLHDNWGLYVPADCELIPIQTDTLAMTIAQRVDLAQHHGPFRLFSVDGGEGGIRTHGTLARTTVFETAPIGHSGTSPWRALIGTRPAGRNLPNPAPSPAAPARSH